jgi:multimeric flavodoxin WrbA
MKVLGIYGSPRQGGNTDILLDEALRGVETFGSEIATVRCCDLNISGCLECGGCDETGECVVEDDMQTVYPKLFEAHAIILASPIFFYGITSQAKALIDRCQALWCRNNIQNKADGKKSPYRGRGYLISVGATKGKNLFEGAQLVAKYFYDALNMTYEGGVLIRSVERRGDVRSFPEYLKQAFDFGIELCSKRD